MAMASSVDRLVLYANCRGSRFAGRQFLMWRITSRSKHFIMIGVRATGRKSFKQAGFDFLGTGIIVALLRQVGTAAWLSDVLKMSVKTSDSCSAQSFKTRPGMLSGPAALRGLTLARTLFTSAVDTWSTWSVGDGGSVCAGMMELTSKRA